MISITLVSGLLSLITATQAHITLAATTDQAMENGNSQTTTVSSMTFESKDAVEVPVSVEQYVRNYFADIPILAEVSRCESTFRQYTNSGTILRGTVNRSDIGLMQINEFYHAKTAKALGLDIYTPEGNMAYARYLYGKEGLKPWISSVKCWNSPMTGLQTADRA